MTTARFDVIVVGLGGMGSAALHHLARRGARVLGIERFERAHDRGSSHGETRLIRRSYFEHPSYVPLLDRAYALWDELSEDRGMQLFERVGLVVIGRPESPILRGIELTKQAHALAIQRVEAREVAARWPLFRARDGEIALFEEDAGFLHVEACVRAHLDAAERAGAVIRTNTIATWDEAGAVHTPTETFECGAVVVCAGAWSKPLGFPLAVRRRVQLWFPCEPRWSRAPAFAFAEPDGFFYGFPSLIRQDGSGATIKVAEHRSDGDAIDPDHLDRDLHEADVARVEAVIDRRLAGMSATPVRHAACMYSMSPDEHFILGRRSNVVFAAGFSGHGFKFAPIVGSVLADLALDGHTTEPIDLFSPDRPAIAGASQV